MSSWSGQELILLLLIGLIILGPKRLPQLANQVGEWLGKARRMTRVMRRQLQEELDFDLDGSKTIHTSKQAATPEDDSESIKPVDQAVEEPAEYVSANEDDDAYSPAHEADGIGTGVGDPDAVEEVSLHAVDDLGAEEDVADNRLDSDIVVPPEKDAAKNSNRQS